MRVLFLTNFYPPVELGGWEQLCQEIVDAFMGRGYEVAVLTSRFRAERIVDTEPYVHRKLFLESDPYRYNPLSTVPHLLYKDGYNLDCLRSIVAEFAPDVVFIWGMWLLNPQLAVLAEELCPGRVAYYMAGFWPVNDIEGNPHSAYWETYSKKLWGRLIKPLVASLVTPILQRRRGRVPQFEHVACVSRFVLEELERRGLPLPTGRVIYNGIDLTKFHSPAWKHNRLHAMDGPLRLVFVGSVTREKGTDIAIQAIARLAQRYGADKLHLTIIGTGPTDFVKYLKGLVQEQQITAYVTFSGWVKRDTIPQRLRDFDVMLFTSSWQEPLARSMMEGMATGLALVSTTTGGSAEFLVHNTNSLTFAAGDPDDLARQIERLLLDPNLLERIAIAGQETALAYFDFDRMVDEVEAFVRELS